MEHLHARNLFKSTSTINDYYDKDTRVLLQNDLCITITKISCNFWPFHSTPTVSLEFRMQTIHVIMAVVTEKSVLSISSYVTITPLVDIIFRTLALAFTVEVPPYFAR